MSLRNINVHLDSIRLSDLFFNFEHPEYDRVMRSVAEPPKGRGKVVELRQPNNAAEITEAVLKDAFEFVGILGLSGSEQLELADELTAG